MHMDQLGSLRLDTERLTIRRLAYSDADAYFDTFTDPKTCSDDGGYPPFTVMDDKFDQLMRDFSADPTRFAIVIRQTGEMIGTIHLMPPLFERAVPCLEIGYCIHRDYRRRGYAAEAVAAMVEHLHSRLNVTLVLAGAFAFNTASQRLLEKLGFIREGITKHDTNHSVYGLVDMVNYYHQA